VGCYIWYSEEGTGRGLSPPKLLLAVQNVTAHPSTTSVPITVLQYNGPLLCGFNMGIKGLTGILKKPQSNGSLYSNTVIGTLVVDGWAVTFGTARRGLEGCGPAQSPSCCTKCNSPPIDSQCTNFIRRGTVTTCAH